MNVEFLSSQILSLLHNDACTWTQSMNNLHTAKELSALFMGTRLIVRGLSCEETYPATCWVTFVTTYNQIYQT